MLAYYVLPREFHTLILYEILRYKSLKLYRVYKLYTPTNKIPIYIPQAFVDTDSSKAIWLLFLDTNTSLDQFFTDINIPFDCQFVVAQPQSDHVVVLTEVYRVSPTLPLQTYRFGNWTAGGGLNWPSQGLYWRRNNLQGHTIQATELNVRRNQYGT